MDAQKILQDDPKSNITLTLSSSGAENDPKSNITQTPSSSSAENDPKSNITLTPSSSGAENDPKSNITQTPSSSSAENDPKSNITQTPSSSSAENDPKSNITLTPSSSGAENDPKSNITRTSSSSGAEDITGNNPNENTESTSTAKINSSTGKGTNTDPDPNVERNSSIREDGEVITTSVAKDSTNTDDDENKESTAQAASSEASTPAKMTGNHIDIIDDGCNSQIKMLLIGETGSGKTSLVELMKNYEKFQDICFDSNKIETFITENDTNKSTCSMDPLTAEINHYELDLKGKKVKWTIIDTPGLNDTSKSAENQCEKSIDKIISHLNKDGSINTICLVVNGTNSRLTSYTRNALQQVLTILPIEMLENIIVVFTKCVNKRRLNFELSVFQAEFGIKIDPKHTFTFDNPYADFISCKQKKIEIDHGATDTDFRKAFEILDDMCDTIMPLTVPLGNKFGLFSRIKLGIEHHLTTLHMVTEEYLTLKYKLLEMNNRLDEAKMTNAEMVQESIFQKVSETTNVVCLYENCFGTCHLECNCANNCAKKCSCFNSGVCGKCGHNWDHHKRGKVEYDTNIVRKHKEMNEKSEEMKRNTEKLEEFLEEFQRISLDFASNVVKKTIDGIKKQALKVELDNKEKIIKLLDDMAEKQPHHKL